MARRTIVVPKEVRARLDRYLAEQLSTSRAVVQRWIREGRVLRDGARAKASDPVGPGMELSVEEGSLPPTRAQPDPEVSVCVVFEDEHLLVIDKPAGLVVHPGKGHWTKTLVNGLLARPDFTRAPRDPRDPEGALRPGVVHRIDKDTSGLLVVAKDEPTREGLQRQFAEHSLERSYLALCAGVPPPGRIETTYGRHPTQRHKFTSRAVEGKRAVTHVEVLERFGELSSLVRCRLETGRTHQIRVHLSEQCKTPLFYDVVYGRATSANAGVAEDRHTLRRQALHACELGFVHPITAQRLRFEAPLPEDMQSLLALLRSSWT